MTEAKLKQLEKRLSQVTLQRDELQRDVESLCMQGSGGSIFDSSSVLSERIFSNEKELSKIRSQLDAVTEERDNLREDLKGYRDTKRQSDNGWKAEKQKVQALEKELAFYQTHSTKAFADRDRAVLEAEQLKADNIDLQRRLAKAESSGVQTAAVLKEAQAQLGTAQLRVAELQLKEQECQALPGLREDLSQAQDQISNLTHSLKVSRRQGSEAQAQAVEASSSYKNASEQLSHERDAAAEAASTAAGQISDLQSRLAQVQAERDQLEEKASTASQNLEHTSKELAQIQADLKSKLEEQQNEFRALEEEQYGDWEKRVSAMQQKEEKLRKQIKDAQAERDQATQDKVQALLRLSDSERSLSRSSNQLSSLKKQNQDLTQRLSLATQEKVNALMQLADGSSSHGSSTAAKGGPSPQKGTWKDTLASWRTHSATASPATSPLDMSGLDDDKDSKSHSAASTPNSH